jgi:hypothetical protein
MNVSHHWFSKSSVDLDIDYCNYIISQLIYALTESLFPLMLSLMKRVFNTTDGGSCGSTSVTLKIQTTRVSYLWYLNEQRIRSELLLFISTYN